MKELLSEKAIKYAYVDICSSVGSLKIFMKIRDTSTAHERVREKHTVGIPCLQIDDDFYVIRSVEHLEELISEHNLDQNLD
ncbi:MAG: hypothetical protein RSD67_01285 [Oscillospiraceae bacterium]